MTSSDTTKLLRECDAGTKMAVSSIDDVLEKVQDQKMKQLLQKSKEHHEKLEEEIDKLLAKYQTDEKEPNPIAKGMSWIKTNMKLIMNESDETIAALMTDGCDMGVKSLSKYLNEYAAADEVSKDFCKKLIKLEDELSTNMREFL